MPDLINWELIRNPINWIIVVLMLSIAVFGMRLIAQGSEGSIFATGSSGL